MRSKAIRLSTFISFSLCTALFSSHLIAQDASSGMSLNVSGDAFSKGSSSLSTITYKPSLAGDYNAKPPRSFWEIKAGTGIVFAGQILEETKVGNLTPYPPTETVITLTEEESKQQQLPFYVGVERSFVFAKKLLYALSVGFGFYKEQLSSSGAGHYPADAPAFTNYTYSFTNDQMDFLGEATWTPVAWKYFAPYVLFGMGLGKSDSVINTVVENEGSAYGAPPSVSQSQVGFVLDFGAGATVMLTKSWGLDLRYVLLKNLPSRNLSNFSTTGPVPFNADTQNILFSLVFRFGIKQ